MEVTISDKYQVVIPKDARKKLGIKPGQKLRIMKVSNNTISYARQPTMEELLDMSAGTLKGAPWQKAGVDAAAWIRRERDAEQAHRDKIAGRG